MKNKIKIGIDLDDTIVSFYKEFINFCKERYEVELDALALSKDFFNSFGSKEKTKRVLKEFVDEGKHYESNVFKDFKKVFNDLERKFQIYFITSRSYDLRGRTKKFLEAELGRENLNINYIHDYPEKTKSFFCKKEGINILIDDHIPNIIEASSKGIKVFVFDQPWNRDIKEGENIIRVKNWEEVLEKLN